MKNNIPIDYPRRKKSMSEEKEREYYDFLLMLVEDTEKGLSQKQILSYVTEKGYQVSQATLSQDLKALNILSVKEQGEKVYRYKEKSPSSDVPVEFYNYVNGKVITFRRNLSILKIPVKRDFEISVCKTLTEYFNKSNIICIPAFKSVCVISNGNHKEKLDRIKDVINKEYDAK